MPYEASNISHQYDLIVPSGDYELKIIKDSDLPAAAKLKLLPVTRTQFFRHLCSKVELAKIFKKQQILSPAFEFVENYDDLGYLAEKLGYPVLLKIDYSGGGAGTFKLNHSGDILNIPTAFRGETLLLQKFIEGRLFDMSGFYQDGKLIHFSCSEFLEVPTNPFGPSILKVFNKGASSKGRVILELSSIGRALGLHGFTNVGFIESSQDGKRYYFEVDVRPNDWINYPSYYGDDPAINIKNYLTKKLFLRPSDANESIDEIYLFANPSRLNFYELITNKYCWITYSSFYSLSMHKLSLFIFNPIEKFKILMVQYVKPKISNEIWAAAKNLLSKM